MSRQRHERIEAESASWDRVKLELKRAAGPFLLFCLLMVAGIFVGADIMRNLAGDKPWVKYKEYRVAFSDTKGVVPSRVELRLAGVKAGSIKKNDLVDGQAVLTIRLEKRYAPLYRDARVRIRPVTPLEDMYVDITSRGHERTGELSGDDILPGQRTISPVEVGTVINVLDKGTRENTAALLNELGRGLDDRGAQLRWAFREIAPFLNVTEDAMRAFAERRQNLARLVHHFGGITAEMGRRDRELAAFVENADATLGTLAANDRPFAQMLAELPGTVGVMRSSFANLRDTEDRLDPALRALQPVAGSLPKGLDALDAFSKDAQPALIALRPAARKLRPLARQLRPTSRSLSSAFSLLRAQAPQYEAITEKIDDKDCLTFTEQFLNRLMSITKYGQGLHNYADPRADVRVDFNSLGSVLEKSPGEKVSQPCNADTQAARAKR